MEQQKENLSLSQLPNGGAFDPTPIVDAIKAQAKGQDVILNALAQLVQILKPSATLIHGRKVVATAGTIVKMFDVVTPCRRIWITAIKSNTGNVCVGTASVKAAAGSENSIELTKTDPPVCLNINDASILWVDASVNGEGVTYSIERD